MLIITIGSESGDKSKVTCNWGPQKADSQKEVREAADSKNKGLRGKKFGNLWFNLQRNGFYSAGDTAHISFFLNSACCPKKTNNNIQRFITA